MPAGSFVSHSRDAFFNLFPMGTTPRCCKIKHVSGKSKVPPLLPSCMPGPSALHFLKSASSRLVLWIFLTEAVAAASKNLLPLFNMDCILWSYAVVSSVKAQVELLVMNSQVDQKKNALARRESLGKKMYRNVHTCHLKSNWRLRLKFDDSSRDLALKLSGAFSSVFLLHPCAVSSVTDIEESGNRQSHSTLSWETVIKAARIFNKPAIATMETMIQMSMSLEAQTSTTIMK